MPVPAHQVERVMLVVVGRDAAPRLDLDDEVAVVQVRRHLGRRADITLAVGRVLQELAEVVAIALGRHDARGALHPEHSLR